MYIHIKLCLSCAIYLFCFNTFCAVDERPTGTALSIKALRMSLCKVKFFSLNMTFLKHRLLVETCSYAS